MAINRLNRWIAMIYGTYKQIRMKMKMTLARKRTIVHKTFPIYDSSMTFRRNVLLPIKCFSSSLKKWLFKGFVWGTLQMPSLKQLFLYPEAKTGKAGKSLQSSPHQLCSHNILVGLPVFSKIWPKIITTGQMEIPQYYWQWWRIGCTVSMYPI